MSSIYLKNLRSEYMAKKFLTKKAKTEGLDVKEDLIEQKARGLSFCLRNAFDYFAQDGSLASRALSTYYGYFSLLSAICMADINNNATLSSLERDTSLGHGAKSYETSDAEFPHSLKVYLTNGGFIYAFKRYEGVNISQYVLNRGIKKIPEDITKEVQEKSISFYSLLERVAELSDFTQLSILFYEIFDVHPEHSPIRVHGTRVEVYSDKTKSKLPYINNWKYNQYYEFYETTIDSNLAKALPVYKDRLVSELFPGFFDPFVLHFLTLYSISIIVRYKPNLWREISEGKLDHFRLLIDYYIRLIQPIVIELSQDRISGKIGPKLLREIQ